jgi:hypothetical protein
VPSSHGGGGAAREEALERARSATAVSPSASNQPLPSRPLRDASAAEYGCVDKARRVVVVGLSPSSRRA